VLVGDDVVFVFWVQRLVLWRDVDGFVGEVGGAGEFLGGVSMGVKGSRRGKRTSKRSARRAEAKWTYVWEESLDWGWELVGWG